MYSSSSVMECSVNNTNGMYVLEENNKDNL